MSYVTSVERLAREEGRVEGLLLGLELVLKIKFGSDGLLLLPSLRQHAQLEVVESIYRTLETATCPADLRRLLEPRSS